MSTSTTVDPFRQAVQHQQAGRLGEAEAICRAIVDREPNHFDALIMTGVMCSMQGRLDEAVTWLNRAVQTAPDRPEVWNNLGVVLDKAGRIEEAIGSYQRAVSLRPEFVTARLNLADLYGRMDSIAEAIAGYRDALSFHPDMAQVHRRLGQALNRRGDFVEAAEAYRNAVALEPAAAEGHNGLGTALSSHGMPEEALSAFREAIRLRPDFALAYNNLGTALAELGQFDDAIIAFDAALRIHRNFAGARISRAMVLLLRGNLAEGFVEYEWRRALDGGAQRSFAQPMWDGLASVRDRTILLHAERGRSDAIQFSRYATLVAERGARVILESPTALRTVLSSVPGVSQIVTRRDPTPPFDLHVPLSSLPWIFKTELSSIPNRVPYVMEDPKRVRGWRDKLPVTWKLRVGLVWAGKTMFKDDHHRAIPLRRFAPLGRVPGVEFFSLQKGEGAEQANNPPPGMQLIDHTPELRDFADIAALLANLDLLISVDSSVLHLAGAMGVQAWALLPARPDWRWLLDRSDSPWYPTIKLFRQPTRGDWDTPIRLVAQELEKLAAAK